MIANLLALYGRHTDRLMVRCFLVCSSEFEIAVVDCEFSVHWHDFYSL
jgi:hypothetical protein